MSQLRIQWLHDFSSHWGAWMWEMSLQVTILVLVVSTISFFLRRRSARLRHGLWLIVLVRLVIPPWFAAPTSLRWWLGQPTVIDAKVTGGTLSVGLDAAQTPLSVATSDVAAIQSAAIVFPFSTWSFTLSEALLLAWAAVVVARLYMLLLGLRRVGNWIGQSSEITDARVCEAFDRARKRVSAPGMVSLRHSDQCGTPVVVGVIKPVVLMPSAVADTLDSEELESVFVHELIHVFRRDGWVQIAQALLTQIYFFHPAMWIINIHLRRTCEQACDEQTIAALEGKRKPYAAAIVKTADTLVDRPRQFAIGMLDSAYSIRMRLQRVLDPKLPFDRGGSIPRALVTLSLAMVMLPSGARSTSPAESRNLPLQSMHWVQAVDHQSMNESTSVQPDHPGLSISEPDVVVQRHGSEDFIQGILEPRPLDTTREQTTHSAQTAALTALKSIDFRVRMDAYAQLEETGSIESIGYLEQAFLNRSGLESDAAKAALDAVWERVRATTTSNSFRAGSWRVH